MHEITFKEIIRGSIFLDVNSKLKFNHGLVYYEEVVAFKYCQGVWLVHGPGDSWLNGQCINDHTCLCRHCFF